MFMNKPSWAVRKFDHHVYLQQISQSHRRRKSVPLSAADFPSLGVGNSFRKLESSHKLRNPTEKAAPFQAGSALHCSLLQPGHKMHCCNA